MNNEQRIKYNQPIHFIEEIPSEHLVTLYIEASAALFLELFSGDKKFIMGDLNFAHTGLVQCAVTAHLNTWANLCREYPNDEFLQMIDHHFYTNHMEAWARLGMV